MKNITRYDGDKGPKKGFCGWRLCLTRSKHTFVRYFTDREFGGKEPALEAALAMRAEMEDALRKDGAEPTEIFEAYRKQRHALLAAKA